MAASQECLAEKGMTISLIEIRFTPKFFILRQQSIYLFISPPIPTLFYGRLCFQIWLILYGAIIQNAFPK